MIPADSIELRLRFSELLDAVYPREKPRAYYHEATESLWFEAGAPARVQGPPGHVHGGFSAALLDEAMGAVAWLHGRTVLAAKLDFRYRGPVPAEGTLYIRAAVTRQDKRRVGVSGELFAGQKRASVSGEGLFIQSDFWKGRELPAHLENLLRFAELRAEGKSVARAAYEIGMAAGE